MILVGRVSQGRYFVVKFAGGRLHKFKSLLRQQLFQYCFEQFTSRQGDKKSGLLVVHILL